MSAAWPRSKADDRTSGSRSATSPSAPASRRARSRTRSTVGPASRTTRATGSSRSPDELGWYPNRAARALSAARADACGLVLARPARTLALEPFFMEFLAGVESELSARSIALTIQLVGDVEEEMAVYRRWWGEHRVDGVLMVDLRVDDPRVDELVRLGLPGRRRRRPGRKPRFTSGLARRGAVIVEAVQYLAALGHRRIAQVDRRRRVRPHACSGSARSSARRASSGSTARSSRPTTASSRAHARRASCSPRPSRPPRSSSTATCSRSPGSASRSRWASRVPDDLSIVGWDDSLISQVVHPPLTAITRDIEAFGRRGRAAPARRRSTGGATGDVETVRGELTPRGSTGSPARLVPLSDVLAASASTKSRLTLNRISDWTAQRHDATLERIPRGAPGERIFRRCPNGTIVRSRSSSQPDGPTSMASRPPVRRHLRRLARSDHREEGVRSATS